MITLFKTVNAVNNSSVVFTQITQVVEVEVLLLLVKSITLL